MKEKTLTRLLVLKEKFGGKLPIIVLGVFVMIYIGFGMVYFQNKSDADDLKSGMPLKETILRNPSPDLEELENELKAAEDALQNILKSGTPQADIPGSMQGIELYEALADLARDSNVEISGIESLPLVTPKDGAAADTESPIALPVLPFEIWAEAGEYEDFLGFIHKLATAPDLLRSVEFVSISYTEKSEAGSADAESSGSSGFTLELRIYVLGDSLSGE